MATPRQVYDRGWVGVGSSTSRKIHVFLYIGLRIPSYHELNAKKLLFNTVHTHMNANLTNI